MNKFVNLMKSESFQETFSYLAATLFAKIVSYIGFFIIVRVMSKSDVGFIELFNSNVNFLLPFASLELHECFLRFTPKTSNNKEVYRSNIFFVLILEISILIFLAIVSTDKLLILGILSLNVATYATYFARSEDRKYLFKLKEVLGTIIQYILLFVFIYIGFNYDGYVYAFIISNLTVAAIVFLKMKNEIFVSINDINIDNLKLLFYYCLPLIPNAFGWWLISSSDRWMINWFIGIENVAIYSVATKFSSLIMMVLNNVYFVVQNRYFISGQEKERKQMCQLYLYITIIISLIGVMIPSFILKFVVGSEYVSSVSLFYLYAPTTMYWAFGAFYGIGSQITKKTMYLTLTMFISAIVNISINFLLIKTIGIEGAIIGSVISLFVWFISRYYINKKIMEISLNKIHITLIFIVQIISVTHYYITL